VKDWLLVSLHWGRRLGEEPGIEAWVMEEFDSEEEIQKRWREVAKPGQKGVLAFGHRDQFVRQNIEIVPK
jgi:hypothetical protein